MFSFEYEVVLPAKQIWTISHNGTELEDVSYIKTKQILDNVGSFEAEIIAPSSSVRSTLKSGMGHLDTNRIEMDRGNETLGFFLEKVEDVGLNLKISGRSYEVLLMDEYTSENYIQTDQTDTTIISDIISNFSTHIDSVSHTGTATTIDGDFRAKNNNLFDAISRCCDHGGRNFWVERTGSDTYTLKTSAERNNGTSYSDPNLIKLEAGVNCTIAKEEKDIKEVFNEVTILGKKYIAGTPYSGDDGIWGSYDGWTESTDDWQSNLFSISLESDIVREGAHSIKVLNDYGSDISNGSINFKTNDALSIFKLNENFSPFTHFCFSVRSDEPHTLAVGLYSGYSDIYTYGYAGTTAGALKTSVADMWFDFSCPLTDFCVDWGSPTMSKIGGIRFLVQDFINGSSVYFDRMFLCSDTDVQSRITVPYRSCANKTDVVCSGYTDENRNCFPVRRNKVAANSCSGTSGSNVGCVHANATASQSQFGLKKGKPIINSNFDSVDVMIQYAQAYLDAYCGYDSDTASWTGIQSLDVSFVDFTKTFYLGEYVNVCNKYTDLDVTGRIQEINRRCGISDGKHKCNITVVSPKYYLEDKLNALERQLQNTQ